MSSHIYRYKFSSEFTNKLLAFIDIHRFDSVSIFKDEWHKWCAGNDELVQRENMRLVELGYTGDIADKMYKSARYYYKNKPTVTKSPKKRRKYVRLSGDILALMDDHVGGNREKPSVSFQMFMEKHKEKMASLKSELREKGIKSEEIDIKIKKTFKNRYFRLMGN